MDRTQFVGASEVAALFGLHSFLTPLQLYLQKTGAIEGASENYAMRRGRHLEPAIASLYAEESGSKLLLCQQTLAHPTHKGLAATPDYVDEKEIPHEMKSIYEMKQEAVEWPESGKVVMNPVPAEAHIMQLNTQIACLDAGRGIIKNGILIYFDLSKGSYFVFNHQYDAEMDALIGEATAKFWKRVEDKNPPTADGDDLSVIHKLFAKNAKDETLNLVDDMEFAGYAKAFLENKDLAKKYQALSDDAKAKFEQRMGDARFAYTKGFKVSRNVSEVKESTRTVKAHQRVLVAVNEYKI
jgi:predicted phage-related endonuclease